MDYKNKWLAINRCFWKRFDRIWPYLTKRDFKNLNLNFEYKLSPKMDIDPESLATNEMISNFRSFLDKQYLIIDLQHRNGELWSELNELKKDGLFIDLEWDFGVKMIRLTRGQDPFAAHLIDALMDSRKEEFVLLEMFLSEREYSERILVENNIYYDRSFEKIRKKWSLFIKELETEMKSVLATSLDETFKRRSVRELVEEYHSDIK